MHLSLVCPRRAGGGGGGRGNPRELIEDFARKEGQFDF